MPQIPTYGGRQVREQALGAPTMGTPDVSSGLQAAARALSTGAEVVDKYQEREAETQANRIDTEVTAGWLQWDAENRRKYQGQNIGEYEVEATKWWDKTKETYASVDPRVRARLGETLGRKRNQAFASVLQHSGAVREQFADQQSDAAAQTTIDFAVDTGDTVSGGARVRQIVAEKAARKGWDTNMVEAENQRLLGTMHLGVITTMAEKDPTKARAYYDANKGEIPAGAQPRVEQVLKAEGDNQFAVQFAAQQAAKPLAEQIKAAGEITDPERRAKALTEVRNNHALVKAAQAESEAAASDEAWQMVGKGKRVPEAVLMRMNGRERVQLQEHLVARAKQAVAGTPVKTDFATWYELSNRIAAGEKVDLRPYATKISGDDLQGLTVRQQASTTPAKQDALFTTAQRVEKVLPGLGIDPKKDPESAYKIGTEVDRRIRVMSAAKGGKDLLPDEVQQIVDDVALDRVYVSEFGRDPQKPLALLKPDELANAYVVVDGKQVKVSSVPLSDRQQIIAALRANKRPVTEQTIVSMYLRAQRKPAAGGTVK